MEKAIIALGVATAAIAMVLFGGLLYTVGGIVAGWIVGLFFEDMIFSVIARTGFDTAGLALWQLGGALGFVGGFFKSVQTNTSK